MFKTRFISILALLLMTATGAWAETTIVTWTSSGSYENNNSRGGVTLSGDVVEYIWDELSGGEWRLAYDYEQGTFTTSLGNFTSIVISGGDIDGFSGTGWNGRTWTGNASSVPFRGYLTDAWGEEPWTITFTIAPAGPTEAQEETLLTTITPTGDGTYSETTAGAVTVTPAGSFFYSGSSYGWRWDSYGSLTVTANEGYTITRCVFIQQGKNQSVTISEAPFALNFEEWLCLENTSMDGVTSIEVYGTAPAAPAASTYTVTLKEGTDDATSWTIAPDEATTTGVAAGTEVKATYGGVKKVKSVKAKKKASAPAVPVTYTALSGGEVLHVGDIIEIPDGQEWRINNSYIMSSRNPLTVVRANITFDQWDELTVTEAADGAYYVIKDTGGWYYCTYEGFTLPVTGTSDGIYVTYNGILWDEYPDYTFSVHEPNP